LEDKMYLRIAAALIVAAFLSAGAWKAYSMGKASVQAEWDLDVAARTAAALEASEKARKREQELSHQVNAARGKYAEQLKNIRTVADAAGVGMRELQAALAGPAAAASASATARADDAARARVVVGECAKVVQGMAALLDERNQQLIGLQEYIRTIHR
jgi:hypothetical protein